MRRRRLPARRGPAENALVKREATTDLRHLEQVVTIHFPVRAARTYLARSLGNPISYKLVEARRGEQVGVVRMVEVRHANGGERTWIKADRVLASGEPASFFVPDHLVRLVPNVDGAAKDSRSLTIGDEIVLHVAVKGYLRFLPAIFHGDGPVSSRDLTRTRDTALQRWGGAMPEEQGVDWKNDEDPLRRFLFIFQHLMTTVTERIDRIVDLTDPLLCEPKFLPWLASWVGFELDESLPVHQQRELVRRAIRLYRARGTRSGIEEMVRVLTSAPVRVRERIKPQAASLGKAVLVGGRDVVERYHRAEPQGAYLLEPTHRASTSFFSLMLEPRDRFRTRFGERASGVLRRIVHVVSQERPVHVQFTVHFDDRNLPTP
jgi:phage tail-like protein